jgi:hypothetical protein
MRSSTKHASSSFAATSPGLRRAQAARIRVRGSPLPRPHRRRSRSRKGGGDGRYEAGSSVMTLSTAGRYIRPVLNIRSRLALHIAAPRRGAWSATTPARGGKRLAGLLHPADGAEPDGADCPRSRRGVAIRERRMTSKIEILRRALRHLLAQHQADGTLPTSARFIFYELGRCPQRSARRQGDPVGVDCRRDARA